MKTDRKTLKAVARKCSIKKKKMVDLKQPVRDTISETISFVIKGKLTPIKPIRIENKFDIVDKTTKKSTQCDKLTKKTNIDDMKPNKIIKRIIKQPAKAKTKVQIETAKNVSPPNSTKKGIEKRTTEVTDVPKQAMKTVSKNKTSLKNVKKRSNLNTQKSEKQARKYCPKIRNIVNRSQKSKVQIKQENPINSPQSKELNSETLKKQQTIDELLKQVNEEMLENKRSVKTRKEKNRSKIESSSQDKIDSKQEESTNSKKLLKIKNELNSESINPIQSVSENILNQKANEIVNIELSTKIKSEPHSDKEESTEKTIKNVIESNPLEKKNSESEVKKKVFQEKKDKILVQVPTEKKINKKKSYRKLKNNTRMTIMKKRVISSKNKDDEDNKCKTKLFGFWNGPKCHRVASLNALAKVHCLYENETRGNMLDIIDEASKLSYVPRRETGKHQPLKIKEENGENDNPNSEASSPIPTRTLRSAPGLRGVGKHWDMHDESSSSEYLSDDDCSKTSLKSIKSEKNFREFDEKVPSNEKNNKAKKRCRKQNEIIMDLKDMVVKKRMASLNASAILAASFSLEKRQSKTTKSDDNSDSYDGSSDEYFALSDTEIKQEDDVKKEGDRKLIEVHTTPNKKVAVILNQDTDVTITGVYVNSTTRSTHHEGYCSIAGMQYRISATSHTQTAATAVATETLLHPSSTSAQDNTNSESLPTSSKSYTPLDALSNMQPPPGPGIQHNHPVVTPQHTMGPPQHVLPMPSHHSPGLRHSCPSAFSSPHSTPGYQISSGHHPPVETESSFVQAGYYQPAGPLISVTHGGGPASASNVQSPAPLSKATSLSEASPTSTTPSVTSNHDLPPPPPSSAGGDSSDSEVVITSVTTAKDTIPPPPPAHHSVSHRYGHHQYPAPPTNYSYTYHSPYTYHTAHPPHNPSYPPPPPHDLCYSSYSTHKYVPSYRRYFTSAQYYPGPAPQDMYSAVPPSGQSQQTQMMPATHSASAVGGPGTYPSSATAGAVHPPPTILETFVGPQTALVETYQPPPPPHYYPPPAAYAPPPTCYTHTPSRALPYISPTYQSCPCPMQSCSKNGLTGPLTGDSKRSNNNSISKSSMPLPPVALALPLEPNSVTGPPSPARGSAGMPPPPSPAGATYQPPPLITKQESQSPENIEKKRKARVGKAMVRNNIAAGMQQNTMLLMCNPQSQHFTNPVKREIESPEGKGDIECKMDICSSVEEIKPVTENFPVPVSSIEEVPKATNMNPNVTAEVQISDDGSFPQKDTKLTEFCPTSESLQPVISTVAENVKVKNMKRKLFLTKKSTTEDELSSSSAKQQKMGSYKYLIKKETSCVKINNGKRKLIEETLALDEDSQRQKSITKSKKHNNKRKLSTSKEEPNKRSKITKTFTHTEETNEEIQKSIKKQGSSKTVSRSSVTALDNLLAKNNIDRTIESVVKEICLKTPPIIDTETKSQNFTKANKELTLNKKSTNNQKTVQNKLKGECKKIEKHRKSKCTSITNTDVNAKVPRRLLHTPRWSNGWRWEGVPYQSKVFINSDEMTAVRKCYPAMMHETGDTIVLRDCVLLKAGPRKNDLPFVAKIASLWENPEDGEMMMSLLWYYRPEHTEQGRLPTDQPDEVFASRHKDSNSVACIDDKCYVLTFNEYCRYRKKYKRIEEGIEERTLPCIPNPEPYPRSHRQPPSSQISPEMIFFCRKVYDFRQKRIMKNPI